MGTLYTNADGLVQNYGTNDSRNKVVRRSADTGGIQTLVVHFPYDDLPTFDQDASGGTTPDRFGEQQAFIPAGSAILRAQLVATTAWTGTGTMDIGFQNKTAAAQDVDALYDGLDVDHADTGLSAVGAAPAANGVGVIQTTGTYDPDWLEAASLTTSDLYLSVIAASGSFTAGAATLVVEYLAPRA